MENPIEDFIHKKLFLTIDEQKGIIETLRNSDPGFYHPITRWGPMSIKMNCLGNHWNAKTYSYSKIREDADGLPCAEIPESLQNIARRGLIETGYMDADSIRPYDVCICNLYPESTGKLGMHQDNSESKEALDSGYPILSLSIGASSIFAIGGLTRTDHCEKITVESGDLIIFGRTKRLAFHGIKKTLKDTTPAELGLTMPCRMNLTFRIL